MKIYIIIGCLICTGFFIVLYNNHNTIDENQNTKSQTDNIDEKSSCMKKYIFVILPDTMSDDEMGDNVVETIGCNDQLIRVDIENCNADIDEVLKRLFVYKDEKSIYYNSFSMSEIAMDHVVHNDKNIDVYLKGDLFIGGMCDVPRVMSQLQKTVLQFDNIDNVTFYINGEKLSDFLSEKD